MSRDGHHKKQRADHPYLAGNFAPVTTTSAPRRVEWSGTIPDELHGGMYVRNGGNPVSNADLGRDAHWFDGDGMLTGVWFDRAATGTTKPTPYFVNQFVLTDLCLSAFESDKLRTPILPSIATLVDPVARLVVVVWSIFRTAILVLLSHLPGSGQAIKRISVANTSILYHDGRALATCESGPPIRVQLPGLQTVGWFSGNRSEGEPLEDGVNGGPGFGGTGINSWMHEWTTGHPKVDPNTGELLLFHCNFLPPFVRYSAVPKDGTKSDSQLQARSKLLNAPVPGCSGGKMMHDFGVSKLHTVILDLPLSLSPFNMMKNQPVVAYEPEKPSRFGVFPRQDPTAVRWFETDGCCIFHTANTWDDLNSETEAVAVNLLACRLTSASVVFSAGNLVPPPHPHHKEPQDRKRISFFAKYDEDEDSKDLEKVPSNERTALLSDTHHLPKFGPPTPPLSEDDEEQCRLYYYRFDVSNTTSNIITHQYALSCIPFEFPTVAPQFEMSFARYIYGCSTSNASFGAALGKATKIDVLVKMDVQTLLERANASPPTTVTGCLDNRSVQEVIATTNVEDPIQAFKLPPKHFAQEARFVSRKAASSEDDGFLLFYVFDESQLDEFGMCKPDASSDLWVLDARDMQTVVCKIHLPNRVPYGLHGNWFTEEQIRNQRPVESLRSMPIEGNPTRWKKVKEVLIGALG
ncbi:carotenoid oxygenase [Bimuria novae-zelandiae CBS 107.79]|uniref:Carotenoid oxygenase n=1 Tax=Bimuria novae-zelandiae CBS 107.79 TaxID=1447943 RepID=A0A6A5UIG7_9PLEO|nr:carotenoid oxygenase [Bimuria novae-zelandiae CBS 107.79]